MKYIRNEIFPGCGLEESQSAISDELAAVWIKNGDLQISDEPWPGLPLVVSYVVIDGPAK